MAITLYGPRAAPFTEKVVRALTLKRLPFELCEPVRPEDYQRWNPDTGLLPVIDVDGERVADSTAILLFLDGRFPEPALLSHDPRTAAVQRRLVTWVDESFFWYWMRWQRISADDRPSGAPFVRPDGAGSRTPLPETPRSAVRSWLSRRDAAPAPEAQRIVREIGARLEDLARMLADRRFFYADRISMADLAVYAMLVRIADDSIQGARAHLDRHPELIEFMKRVEQETGG